MTRRAARVKELEDRMPGPQTDPWIPILREMSIPKLERLRGLLKELELGQVDEHQVRAAIEEGESPETLARWAAVFDYHKQSPHRTAGRGNHQQARAAERSRGPRTHRGG